jgi:hypothetical protein
VWAGSRKGLGVWGHGQETRCHGRVHDREHGRFGAMVLTGGAHGTERAASEWAVSADVWGSWDRERGWHARVGGADSSVPPGSEREREGSAWAQAGTDRRGPAVRGRAGTRAGG